MEWDHMNGWVWGMMVVWSLVWIGILGIAAWVVAHWARGGPGPAGPAQPPATTARDLARRATRPRRDQPRRIPATTRRARTSPNRRLNERRSQRRIGSQGARSSRPVAKLTTIVRSFLPPTRRRDQNRCRNQPPAATAANVLAADHRRLIPATVRMRTWPTIVAICCVSTSRSRRAFVVR